MKHHFSRHPRFAEPGSLPGGAYQCEVEIVPAYAEEIGRNGPEAELADVHGILIPGGFGGRGMEGKILAAKFARENGLPFLGICLGLQCAVVEFARNVCGLDRANSTESDPDTPHPVIDFIPEQRDITDKGATMRLGEWPCHLKPGSVAQRVYGGQDVVSERHRHRYEVNNQYRPEFGEKGMVFSGVSPDDQFVEMIELPDHPYFIATQAHPEFRSYPTQPHPLFAGLVGAAIKRMNGRG